MAPHTILIVDDTPDHRDILARLLRATGYRVLEATPAEVLDRANGERPDLILFALSLPGQHAWETARQLHTIPALAATPILGSTLYPTLIKRSRVHTIGCVDYIDKPFDLDDLLDRIAGLLRTTALAA
ncbi:MAG: response regulator [Chloroflexi bacterium]|nr:response regulator [Chloroflexota bacterium]